MMSYWAKEVLFPTYALLGGTPVEVHDVDHRGDLLIQNVWDRQVVRVISGDLVSKEELSPQRNTWV